MEVSKVLTKNLQATLLIVLVDYFLIKMSEEENRSDYCKI